MTDTEAPTTIIDRLKLWKESLEEGDIREAIEHHDAVQEHILKNNDGSRVFRLAEMNPGPFVEWARMKAALKEQLGKSHEQRLADYEEARDAFADLADRARDAKEARDVIKLVSQAQPILQQLLLNAGALDEKEEGGVHFTAHNDLKRSNEEPTPEEKLPEHLPSEEPPAKSKPPRKQRAKKPKTQKPS